ncbi:MAG: hypothetical protein KatS3mg082_2478 [Nitrospiraceae bacterium]|nr:MAG: hypothetical protein KatS3mg082_2478 [Nitrospiraceae bacterium]
MLPEDTTPWGGSGQSWLVHGERPGMAAKTLVALWRDLVPRAAGLRRDGGCSATETATTRSSGLAEGRDGVPAEAETGIRGSWCLKTRGTSLECAALAGKVISFVDDGADRPGPRRGLKGRFGAGSARRPRNRCSGFTRRRVQPATQGTDANAVGGRDVAGGVGGAGRLWRVLGWLRRCGAVQPRHDNDRCIRVQSDTAKTGLP